MKDQRVPFIGQNKDFQCAIYAQLLEKGHSKYYSRLLTNWICLNDRRATGLASKLFIESADNKDFKERLYTLDLTADKSIGIRLICKILLKVMLHQLFVCVFYLRPALIDESVVIRAYVENTEEYFKEVRDCNVVLLLPFPIKVFRQIKYYFSGSSYGRRLVPIGNFYGFVDLIGFFLRRDRKSLIRLEVRAGIRQALVLRQAGVKKVLSSEEFNPVLRAQNMVFRRLGGRTENFAHGVGLAIPFPYFDKCLWRTKTQEVRYSNQHWLPRRQARKIPPIRAERFMLTAAAVVYFGQFTPTSNSLAKVRHEQRVLGWLLDLPGSQGRVFYKNHPNQIGQFPLPAGVQIWNDQFELRDCVWLSGYSTAILESPAGGFLSSSKLINTDWLFEYDDVEILDFG